MKKLLRPFYRSNSQNKKSSNSQTDNVESFLLIEGNFAPADAAEVLLSLLNDKIKFHTVQLLNLKDTNKIDSLNSENRINYLKQAKGRMTEIILDAQSQGEQLKIHSTIEITKAS
ncbi:hypothetical protein DKG77_05060 [Flagellimonas aquimarina]|uniref:Uncharacterized protein n=1 Tax=Flagellimonas aquimarina TaxID=2201895 RepID=A0A316L5J9_9FLAO|nr:hypothetical protein [Allomuricauda koreensis]PWL40195.1 hypothetical protein DKG77_05060 [Allomuricauda koreensis]